MNKIYIRFGEIPLNERSNIYRNDEGIVGEEIGVSVYEGINDNGKIKVIMPSLTGSACVGLSGCIKKKMYIVKGKVVGIGSDGEPLLRNIKITK